MVADLGGYLARRTCAHARESWGGPKSDYVRGLDKDNLFTCNSPDGNSYSIWFGYTLKIQDEQPEIRVVLGRKAGLSSDVVKSLESFRIPQKYRNVISSVEVKETDEGLVMLVRPVKEENSSHRTQNEDKLFNALHNVVSKPVYNAVLKAGAV